jgi:uncharacterized protein DUF4157
MNRQTPIQTQAKGAPPSPGGVLQRKCACGQHAGGGECEECRKKKQSLQRRKGNGFEPAGMPPIVHDVLRSPGQPLDATTRAFMEPRFGHDFSRVRVHTGAKAVESARAVNALAYTVGQHIVFGTGRSAQGKNLGNQLLAHELTHTIQQDSIQPSQLDISLSNEPCEEEANRLSSAMIESSLPLARRFTPALRAKQQLHRQMVPVQGSSGPQAAPTFRQTPVPAEPENASNKPPTLPGIEPADVLVRAGTFSGKNPLVTIIGEQYNHGGVALSGDKVHHVESNGYETVSVKSFFAPENSSGGAVLRFKGKFKNEIAAKVVDIASSGRYVKIPGNPFSAAENLTTVNCNEFVHELYRQAIAEEMTVSQSNSPDKFSQLLAEYGDPSQAGKAKPLIRHKDVEFQTGGLTTGPAIAAAEAAGSMGVSKEAKEKGEVKVKFEGKIEMRNLYPAEWATSWNPFKVDAYSKGFYTVAVLRTFTPDSFINSQYFGLVKRVSAGGP